MSTPWYEKIPKKDREAQLRGMNEGQFLRALRKASATHVEDRESVSQVVLAKAIGCKPGRLRDIESGIVAAEYRDAKVYCEAMGVPIEILKKVGRGKFKWPTNGDSPGPEKPPEKKPSVRKTRSALSEEEKGRQRALRAENRVLEGADQEVEIGSLSGITVRNQTEESVVLTFKVTAKGNLFIDVHQDCVASGPTELLKDGFTGVRVACPPIMEWDVGAKQRRVFDINVPTKRTEKEDD